MTILFARTAPCGRGEDGAAEITIKGLCGGALTGRGGGRGRSPGCPPGLLALDPPPLILAETMLKLQLSLLSPDLIHGRL